jgi:hypothetical protein
MITNLDENEISTIMIKKGQRLPHPWGGLIHFVSREASLNKHHEAFAPETYEELTVPAKKLFWKIVACSIPFCLSHRIIVAPRGDAKAAQRLLCDRLSVVKTHKVAYGFVKDKNALMCATTHTEGWGGAPGLLIKIDISNFFNSFSGAMLDKALSAHGFVDSNIETVLSLCTISSDPLEEHVQNILGAIFGKIMNAIPEGHLTSENGAKKVVKYLIDMLPVSTDMPAFDKELIEDKEAITALLVSSESSDDDEESLEALSPYLAARIVHFALKAGPNIKLESGARAMFQGGACSPPLSNLGFKLADYRLDAYCKKVNCIYTRYADDLCFSFGQRKGQKFINIFINGIKNIISDSGFFVNTRKVAVLGRGAPQKVVGYCLNSGRPTISKKYRKSVTEHIQGLAENGLDLSADARVAGMLSYVATTNPKFSQKMKIHYEAIKTELSGGVKI